MQEPLLTKKSSKMGQTQLGLFAGTVLLVTLALQATAQHHTMLIDFPTTSSVLPTGSSIYYQVENYPGMSVRVRVDVPLCMYVCTFTLTPRVQNRKDTKQHFNLC